jgi:hypothetical protein
MKKNFLYLIIISFLTSCVFDTYIPSGMYVKNKTNDTIFVKCNCRDEIDTLYKVREFQQDPRRPVGTPKDTILYYDPVYKAFPDSLAFITECDSTDLNRFTCKTDSAYIFIFDVSIIRKYSWEEIVKNKIYSDKIKVSFKDLDSFDYKLNYDKNRNPKFIKLNEPTEY